MAIELTGHFEVDGRSPPDGKGESWFTIAVKPEFKNGELVALHTPGVHQFKTDWKGERCVLYMRRVDPEEMN